MTIKEQRDFVAQTYMEQLDRVCNALNIPVNVRESFITFYLVKQGLGWMLEAYAENMSITDQQYGVIKDAKTILDDVLYKYKSATFYPDDFSIPDDMVNQTDASARIVPISKPDGSGPRFLLGL